MDWMCFCVLLIWTSCVCSTKLHYDARVTVKNEVAGEEKLEHIPLDLCVTESFCHDPHQETQEKIQLQKVYRSPLDPDLMKDQCKDTHAHTHVGISRFSFENQDSGSVKLVSTSDNIIWIGRNENLYSIEPAQDFKPKLVNVSLCQNESEHSNNSCPYRLSLIRQGVGGNLFFCGSTSAENTKCCNLNSSYSLIGCFKLDNYVPFMNEPSLLVDDMLYFTKPGKGLFRVNKDNNYNIWSQHPQTEQKYLKLIAGKGPHNGKLYSFFAEKYKSKDGEPDQWIPRVSQSCMNDRGGPKAHLQNSWTSMIYARLLCGRGHDFSQLIDAATLQMNNEIKIYALFRNYWNMSAVCVYNMTEISSVFTSSEFTSATVPAGQRPGTCVGASWSLSSEVLNFMSARPEMKDWVMPENGPLLFTHRHYTHIQVDREQDKTVLLLSLESGGVHKVLEEPVFVIAEYLPFPHGTHITGMLLDTSENRLFVSSSNEVVQIDLKACSVHGNECIECMLSRDPYCDWSGLHCTSAAKGRGKVPHVCSTETPQAAPSKTGFSAETRVVHVPASSRHFLLCPMTSHHATYHWHHGDASEECVRSDQGCLYLIESMNETHEGSYACVSSENNYNRTVNQYKLRLSHAHRLTPTVLLLLIVMSLSVLGF